MKPNERRDLTDNAKSNGKIKIIKNGPYIVSGNIPIAEKIIVPQGREYEFKEGDKLPQSENYALCRCGKSKMPPFCDGTHAKINFNGDETASKKEYRLRAELMRGYSVDLMDDGRCAFARFCHRKNGNAWELVNKSGIEKNREEAIIAANDCPAGRLLAVDKDGTEHEPFYDPSIDILQDPEQRRKWRNIR
ncbi:MAG: CDGSH iron-sulfur domain-containing protein [Lachnospiraceae bacterium]|nr:CDGSH iron-sulfur domain-containing protein [Lachnospiraceae bacterium]